MNYHVASSSLIGFLGKWTSIFAIDCTLLVRSRNLYVTCERIMKRDCDRASFNTVKFFSLTTTHRSMSYNFLNRVKRPLGPLDAETGIQISS